MQARNYYGDGKIEFCKPRQFYLLLTDVRQLSFLTARLVKYF